MLNLVLANRLDRSGDGVPGVEVHKHGVYHLGFMIEVVEVELVGVLLAKGLDCDFQSLFVDKIAELPLRNCRLVLHLIFEDGLRVVLVAMLWLVVTGFFGHLRPRLATPVMRCIFSWPGQDAHIYHQGVWRGCWLPPPPCAD